MIKIKIHDQEVKTLLNQIQSRGGNMTLVMRRVAGVMRDAVEENFSKEGRPKWAPLKPSTIKQRKKEGKWPGKILQKSAGGLAQSFSTKATANAAIVGTNKKYAAIHQFGGPAGKGHKANIPARPFLKLTSQDMGDIKMLLMDYLLRGK